MMGRRLKVRASCSSTTIPHRMVSMTDDELKSLLEASARENAAGHAETRARFDSAVAETKRHFDSAVAETKRHFDVVAERMEMRIDAVAESVAALDEKVERKIDDLDERMRLGFVETQAMIKFSHAELDRRVRALEQAFADLQTRVERLESTTH